MNSMWVDVLLLVASIGLLLMAVLCIGLGAVLLQEKTLRFRIPAAIAFFVAAVIWVGVLAALR